MPPCHHESRPSKKYWMIAPRALTFIATLVFAIIFAADNSIADPDHANQSKQGDALIQGSKAGPIRLNNQIASYSFPHRVVSIAWSPDGRRLAVSYDEDKQVALIDRKSGRTLWTIEKLASHYPPPCCRLVFSPNGSRLYTASAVTRGSKNRDTSISVLDAHDGSIIGAFIYSQPRAAMAVDMALSRDGNTLYAIPGMTNEVIAFDTLSGAVTQKFVAEEGDRETGKGFTRGRLVLDEDRKRLWFAHQGSLLAWTTDGRSTAQVQAFQVEVTAMALNSKTGDVVAGGTATVEQGRYPLDSRATNVEIRTYSDPDTELVRAFDGATAKLKLTYNGPGSSVEGLAVSSDGELIVATRARTVTGEHAQLIVWDAVTGQMLAMRDCGSAGLGDVAFGPDSRLIAYVENNSVKVLKIAR